MLRALYYRSNGTIATAIGSIRSVPYQPLSSRTMLLTTASVANSEDMAHRFVKKMAMAKSEVGSVEYPAFLYHRSFHGSGSHLMKSMDDVHINIESGSSKNTNAEKSSSTLDSSQNSGEASSSSSGGACSQGIPNDVEEEEEEQEEMFVVADPVLKMGNIREWGGPRRGGTLAEPTRFGDWERKGRCTDF